jgi:hypothetical protein
MHQWSAQTPASMHCAMYALYAEKHVGLSIEYVDAKLADGSIIPHYRNFANGTVIDYSQSQFPPQTEFLNRRCVSPDEILALQDREAERFIIFERKVLNALGL